MTEYENAGMTNGDVEVTITTKGPEEDAESVHIHAVDAIAKALQAVDERKHPDECDGYFYTPDWEARLNLNEQE